MDALARHYLDKGPPFLGESDFRAKVVVKDAGARWDGAFKKWTAPDVLTLCRLVHTGYWMPVGLSPRDALRLADIVKEQACAEETAAEKKLSHATLKKGKQSQTGVAQTGKCLTEYWLPVELPRRLALRPSESVKERACTKEAMAEKKHSHAILKNAEQDRNRAAQTTRTDLDVPPNEPEIMEKVLAHGVTAEVVSESATWSFLGPRSGISDARRVVRGVSLGVVRWEEIISGDARIRSSIATAPKSTGARGGERGVKRGRREEGVCTLEFGPKAKQAQQEQPPQRLAQLWKPPLSYCYTAKCGDCNSTLDSRLQFGLECGCGKLWVRCGRCFVPMASGVNCVACA